MNDGAWEKRILTIVPFLHARKCLLFTHVYNVHDKTKLTDWEYIYMQKLYLDVAYCLCFLPIFLLGTKYDNPEYGDGRQGYLS